MGRLDTTEHRVLMTDWDRGASALRLPLPHRIEVRVIGVDDAQHQVRLRRCCALSVGTDAGTTRDLALTRAEFVVSPANVLQPLANTRTGSSLSNSESPASWRCRREE